MDIMLAIWEPIKMKISITLDDTDWGQIIDGLNCRAEIYEATVIYYETGLADGPIAEVTDEEEAQTLAATYRALIENIQRQRH
jgi:hypothetical protein